MPDARVAVQGPIFQLRVTLDEIDPPIWRVIQVAGGGTLYRLHLVIQAAMGWENYHLFEFTIGKVHYGIPDADDWQPIKSAKRVHMVEVLNRRKQRFQYQYDFGDAWNHTITVEDYMAPVEGVRYPICLDGQRACPPEDCGGAWAYEQLLEAIVDPEHEEHDELLQWLGGSFDPEEFDLEQVNAALRRTR